MDFEGLAICSRDAIIFASIGDGCQAISQVMFCGTPALITLQYVLQCCTNLEHEQARNWHAVRCGYLSKQDTSEPRLDFGRGSSSAVLVPDDTSGNTHSRRSLLGRAVRSVPPPIMPHFSNVN